MTSPAVNARRLAALAALALAGPALAVDVTGSLGGGLYRSDAWSGGLQQAATTWDWYANLAASGSPFAPGLLDWSVGGDYRGRRDEFGNATSLAQGLTGRAALTLFGQKDSPLTLRLDGSRSHDWFTSRSDTETTGSSDTLAYGASLSYREASRPNARVAFSRIETDTHLVDQTVLHANSSRISAGATHGSGAFNYALAYDLTLSDGTFDQQNYRNQQLTLRARARLSPGLELSFSEAWFQRTPTAGTFFNPAYEDQQFGLDATWRVGPRLASRTGYGYAHFTVDDGTRRERLRNGVIETLDYQAAPSLRLSATGAFDSTEDRVGDTSVRGLGAYLVGQANWVRPTGELTWGLDGSATGGTYRSDGGPASGAVGASLAGTARWNRDLAGAGLSYSFGWSSNTGGFKGWGFNQQVMADGELRAGDDWRFHGSASASASRAQIDAAGTSSAQRQLLLTLGAAWRRWDLQVTGSQSEGLNRDLADPVRGDGLLSTSYNGANRSASAALSTPGLGGLHLTLIARWLDQTFPDRPDQWERGFSVQSTYQVGAFALSLEERWAQGGTGGTATGKNNLLMVRLSRNFGWRF